MRVAICLSGHLRSFERTAESFWRAFGHLSPDVYMHTWNVTTSSDSLWWAKNGEPFVRGDSHGLTDRIHNLYKPKALTIDPEVDFEIPDHIVNPQARSDFGRMRRQWCSTWRADQLRLANGEWYDVVVKTRPDIRYHTSASVNEMARVAPENLFLTMPYFMSIRRGVFSDTVVIARQEIMEQYVGYFHAVDKYLDRSKLPDKNEYCSEYGATAYVRDHNIWGARHDYSSIKAEIVRDDGPGLFLS